ncbi:cellulose 1,4-beta-cellobiosidase [Paenibacillus sp. BIHB 4019]|uniref:Cellulose 1,4-beta-cellobiosidase n=1 Tax=Paenibacillus sp. BIHB 4019 TaxID=1870819 RepID=A0A1B2DDK1_9BACL|nr:glycoside hydrolase family 48 protein [Paenibacillus sp. BIHB 4019]ANY65798.1 cellulose 1,4-beta-cellobiosidase [Paenibacillus sp. BIHB 4019]
MKPIFTLKASKKVTGLVLSTTLLVTLSTGLWGSTPKVSVAAAAAVSIEESRFLQMYDQIKNPANGYFSPEGIPYHSIETLISEAPDYGHMSTSEAYSYWLWLETLYGHYTQDWSHLEAAWDNMEKYIIPVNEGDGKEEQPTMSFYNPNSPATYADEKPFPDQYPVQLSGKYAAGKDPLDAELKATYGNNQTYLMHWLIDVDNWYNYGNLLNPTHTSTYVNTFQRGEQESVWEAIPHPSQDNQTFGKTGEGFMSLFTKENQAPAKQWRYTNATDADGRAVQVMYWAKELGYNNTAYLNKAKKMGDYLRYGMYDKYFQKIGSASGGAPTPGTGKDSSSYLMAWYTSWGGGLEQGAGNWAWRIGASHAHQAYQNPVAAYALSTQDGGLIPTSATAQTDWNASLKRQLEFYTWLQSSEGAMGGGATNSWNGQYSAYPAGVSKFYGMAYDEAPVYHDPDSNTWFGFQVWPLERVAELYYILAENGDLSSENFQMAKTVIQKWVDWTLDYVFVDERPVTDADGYYLNAQGQRILGGTNVNVATVAAPGEFWIPGGQEWNGQPDTWNGFSSYTGNPTYHATTINPSQDVGALGTYVKALAFFAAGTQAETGSLTPLAAEAKEMAGKLLDTAWTFNDGVGIVTEEQRADYNRFFTKEIYLPSGWTGKFGQGNMLPGSGAVASDPAKGGNGVYIGYADLRPLIQQDPQWSYLSNLYNTSWNNTTRTWDNGVPTFKYHRFWSQVDIATAYAEYDRLLGTPAAPTVPGAPATLTGTAGNAQASLSWSTTPGATSYNVKRAATTGGPYTTVATAVSGTSYSDTSVTNGTTYYYVVTAVNAVGESVNSAQVAVTPQAPGAVVPGAFTVTGTAGNASAALSWTAASGADFYNVERSSGGSAFASVATGLTTTAYTDASAVNGTHYTYRIVAENAAGTTLSNTVAVTPVAPPVGGNLKVQYRAADTNATNNAMMAHFNILNNGTTAVDLSTLKIRYYFTADGTQQHSFWSDYAQVGSSNVHASFVTMSSPTATADTYMEISFTAAAGSIAAGGTSGQIQTRVSKNDWSNLNEANDYSFDATKTSLVDWNKVTLYQNGTLVWGIEP